LLLISCGGGEDTGIEDGPPVTPPVEITLETIYVSAERGADSTESGSIDAPFKTLSAALRFVENSDAFGISNIEAIVVDSGIYTEGESFPIVVEGDIEIIAQNDGVNNFPIISGSGTYIDSAKEITLSTTLVLKNSAKIRGLIVDSAAEIALYINGADEQSLIQSVGIFNCNRGIVTSLSTKTVISNSTIEGCNSIGIETLDASTPTIKETDIKNNMIGIVASHNSSPILEINSILDNLECDFLSRSQGDLSVLFNIWNTPRNDIVPVAECENGNDIVVQGAGSVFFNVIPPKGIPAIPGTILIDQIQPEFGSFINSNQPTLIWTGTTTDVMVVGIFTNPPEISEDRNIDLSNLEWVWHPGLDKGSFGAINFDEGGIPLDSSLSSIVQHPGLTKGAAYYWMVWQWDSEAIEITHSSQLGFFTVRF